MTSRPSSPFLVAVAGLMALVVAIGIGRFAFTPILPMMQADSGLSVAAAGWLASANYAGYLLGAMSAIRFRFPTAMTIRMGLLGTALSTLAMALFDNFANWAMWRFVAGVMSAWAFVYGASWALQRLATLGRPRLSGVVFGGVGVGITIAGAVCLVLMNANASSATAWIVFAALAFIVALVIWPAFDADISTSAAETPTEPMRWDADSWRLVWCYGISGFGYIIPATFVPAMARTIVPDPAVFGWSWPVFGAAAFLSTLIAAGLADRFRNRAVWGVSHLVMAVGVALPVFWSGIGAIMLAGLMVGGTFMVVVMTALQEARDVGRIHATALIAAITTSFAVGQIIGPITVSYLIDMTGGFSTSLIAASVLLCVSGVVLLRATPSAMTRR